MKSLTKVLMIAASFMFALAISAQEADKGRDKRTRGRRGGNWGGMTGGFDAVEARKRMDELRKEADKDGDGQLNQEERRAYFEGMRNAWQKHRDDFTKKWDKNEDGEVDDEERKAFQENQVDEEFTRLIPIKTV